MYEPAVAEALTRLGHHVIPFRWGDYLQGTVGRAQEKWLLPGTGIAALNRDLVRVAAVEQPDIVLIWRGTPVRLDTLRAIRAVSRATLISYNNDDPFGPSTTPSTLFGWTKRTWTYYLAGVPEYDVHFVYRPVNVREMQLRGARHVYVLRPYYVPSLHHPFELSDSERRRFECDVVFAGHYEPDGRLECLKALAHAGLKVKVFGPASWNRQLNSASGIPRHIEPLVGLDYAKALCGAHMALCFLSRLNRDTYTRRCFEIPACGVLLLSERTDDLRSLLAEGEEAVFFSGPSELVEKALWLRDNLSTRQRIAAAGHRRVLAGQHSVDDRMREMLEIVPAVNGATATRTSNA